MSGGGSRVSIPNNVRKMIQDIKEIAGNHTDDDIYNMLKDCNMDPNETAQKLLYIDTFHEVKKKRERKNLNMSSRSEDNRWTSGINRRSSRGGRWGYSSPLNDDGGGKNVITQKDNGVNSHPQKGHKPSMPVSDKTDSNATTHPSKLSIVSANGQENVTNENSCHGSAPQLFAGAYSAASDPVVDQHLNTRGSSAVGTINHQIGSQHINLDDGNKSTTGQNIAKTIPVSSVTLNSNSRTGPINSHQIEDREMPSLPANSVLRANTPNPVTLSPQQPSSASKVVATMPPTISFGNLRPLPVNKSVCEEATPNLDNKLEKLNISAQQTVILPQHLQVPEALKNQLTFGSLDSIFGPKDSSAVAKSDHMNNDVPKEPLSSNEIVCSTTQDGNITDNHHSSPQVPENNSNDIKPLEENNISSASVQKYEPSKQVTLSPPEFPLLQSTPPDYSFGIVPPVIGSHLVQLDGQELQPHDTSRNPDLVSGKSPVPSTSSLTSSVTQPAAVAQNAIAVSPQLFPFYQQPYPPNYFPYNPYFPHVFYSQNAHQFFGHNGFPQQPSTTTNVYMPPPVATASTPGGKLPVASQYKLGTNAGNLTTHLGIPSGYGTYGGSSAIGYSPSAAAVIPGSSANSEDLAASDLKEKSTHSTTQQGEDSRAWSSAAGRDIPNLHPNYYYNLPQGQHVAFPPAQSSNGSFAGLYHPSQTTVTPPTVRSLIHQSHATAGPVDSVVPSPGPYQQPRIAQMNWNSTLLNRENI